MNMKPLLAYSAHLTPPPAAQPLPGPHHRADDHAQALDRQTTAAMARFWQGISPISLALAYTDWALHLWSSPGSQARLSRQALAHGADWWADALRQPQVAVPPASLAEAAVQDPRFQGPAWQWWPWRGLATASKAWVLFLFVI